MLDEFLLVRVTTTKKPQQMLDDAAADATTEQQRGPLQTEIDAVTCDMAACTKVTLPIVNIEELVLQSDVRRLDVFFFKWHLI